MVMSSSEAGAEIRTFLAPASMCFLAAAALVKKPVDSMTMSTPSSPPGEVGRVALGQDLDGVAVDDEVAFLDLNGFGQAAADGVVLEQVGQCLGAGEVVDGNDLKVRTLSKCSAEVVAADAAEAVDTNTGGHFFSLLCAL